MEFNFEKIWFLYFDGGIDSFNTADATVSLSPNPIADIKFAKIKSNIFLLNIITSICATSKKFPITKLFFLPKNAIIIFIGICKIMTNNA